MERIIYFTVGSEPGTTEAAHFTTDTPAEELKELFRAAGEAGPKDILKLYTPAGRLVNIAPSLAANTPDSPYRLQVVGTQCNGMLLDEVGIDLLALEQRVTRLEKQIRVDFDELPPIVQELKSQVDRFRSKLETTEHLSWLGFYKQLPPPLSSEECRRLQYRRKSEEQKRRVRDKFYSICDVAVSEEVRLYLRQPTFDCHQWEDEEILLLLQQMYLDLELTSKFGIELPVLRAFLYEVYKNYNEVPFHNFRHCFCVAQMMYSIVWCVDLPSKIGDLEILILLTSCICHDLDHPGFNNIYQINAKTELALRYNDISPLENHHCSVAFRVLEEEDCNIFRSLPSETFRQVREGVIRCILATDMARHNEILAQFKEITPEFDFNNKAHTNLLSMVLIKVADISNEARPMDVAEPWLDRLLQEFFKQSDAEKLEGLPVTPFMDRDKITKPSSQCSFIGFVLLPLFEALGELFTELQDLIVQPVRDALDYFRRLNEAAKDERMHRKSVIEISDNTGGDGNTGSSAVVKSSSAHSVKSRRSLGASSRSRSAEEDDDGAAPPGLEGIGREFSIAEDEEHGEGNSEGMQEGHQDDETFDEHGEDDEEEEEEETVTEVEVSEKTLKFKISTEGSVTTPTGRKSYPGSRKGSREKSQMLPDYHHHELARAIRDHHYRNNYDGSGGSIYDSSSTAGTTPTSPPPRSRDRPSPSTSIVSPSQPSKGRFVPLHHRNSLSANFMSSSHSSSVMFTNTRHVTARELCNGETKCFDDTPGSVKYSADEERKLSDGSQKEESKKDVGSSEDNKEETEENEPADEVRIAATNPKKSTLLSRLRNFTDKLSFNSSSRELEESTSSAEFPPSTSPLHCNKFEMQDVDCQHNISRSSSSNKAMTLPKTRKPQRRNNASGGRRGWRSLIASSSKSDSPPSSASLPDSSSPSTRRQLGCKNKRNSLCNAPEREDAQAKNGPSPTRDVLQDQDKDDDSSLPPQPSSAPPTTRKEKRQSGGLSGSLDSIVKVQEGSSGNNNNQKKGWSSPGGRRGLLAKLGRSSTHTEGTCSPRQDEDDSKTHNWITSLAANFRSKRNHQHQTISGKKPPSPPCQLPPTAQMPQK